jgi:hypothetical protein
MTTVPMPMPSRSRFAALVELAAEVAGIAPAEPAQLAETLLAIPPDNVGPRGGVSGLNYDQSPLQLCISLGPEGMHAKLMADPASTLGDAAMRYDASYAALLETIPLAHTPEMRDICERTLRLNLPETSAGLAEYPDGILWLGAGAGIPGIAMYVDARRGGPAAAWPRLRAWFTALLPDASAMTSAIDAIQNDALLMCLGVEGISPAMARAKLYWRFSVPTSLDAIGIPRFADPRFRRFLEIVMRDREIRLTGIVPSIGFRIDTGALSDVKLDVCTCRGCLDFDAAAWREIVEELSSEFGFRTVPIERWLRTSELAFVGFGIDHRETPRLNLYLKEQPLRDSR